MAGERDGWIDSSLLAKSQDCYCNSYYLLLLYCYYYFHYYYYYHCKHENHIIYIYILYNVLACCSREPSCKLDSSTCLGLMNVEK